MQADRKNIHAPVPEFPGSRFIRLLVPFLIFLTSTFKILLPLCDRSWLLSLFSLFFRLIPAFHDVALREEDAFQQVAPYRFFTQEKFKIHAEVFELFVLGVAHDRAGDFVFLDGEALFVPIDCFRLFDERLHHPGEGSCFFGQFIWRFMVLFGGHCEKGER